MTYDSQEHGHALKQLEHLLPSVEELGGNIEALLPMLVSDPIDDLLVYNYVKAQFDEKDNLASNLENKMSEVRDLEQILKDEVRRCQDNLGALVRGEMSLNGLEVKINMQETQTLQEEQLTNVEELAQKYHRIMSVADEILNSARSKHPPVFIQKLEPRPDMLTSSPFASRLLSMPYSPGLFSDPLIGLGPMNGGFNNGPQF